MRYDDRLATVLRIRPASAAVARIQFQQLIDLLGTSPADARNELLDEAYVRIAELAIRLPARERADALCLASLRLRSPRLVAELCSAEPQVAQAAIRAADLEEAQWLDLIPALPAASRSLLRARRDFPPSVRALLARLGIGDAALPASAGSDEAALEAVAETVSSPPDPTDPGQTVIPLPLPQSPAPSPPPPSSGIGAIVERIEAFRRARDAGKAHSLGPANDLPQLPLGEAAAPVPASLATIDFVTDPSGRVSWCSAAAAPLLVGTNLARFEPLRVRMRQRQPLRAIRLDLAGGPAIAGTWQIDGAPHFESGRFAGYRGRLRRPATLAAAAPVDSGEADRLRQVLHELRTPVNAIQGFAEIIQHQLYGPTPHEYRALAANIVADAARMLAGFEELERLARLQTGAIRPEPGQCDFAAIATAAVTRLRPQLEARGVILELAAAAPRLVPVAPAEAERLCWRLLSTVAATATEGDGLVCSLASADGWVRLNVPMPAALAGQPAGDPFSAAASHGAPHVAALPGGMFGTGFALRLARAEARACGGSLIIGPESINLCLPVLTSIAQQGDNDQQGRAPGHVPAA